MGKGLSFHMTGPVTISDLRRDGKLLEVGCTRCWNVRYVDAASTKTAIHLEERRYRVARHCSRAGGPEGRDAARWAMDAGAGERPVEAAGQGGVS